MSTYNDEILRQIAEIDAQLKAQGSGPMACAGLAMERMNLEFRLCISDLIRENEAAIARTTS